MMPRALRRGFQICCLCCLSTSLRAQVADTAGRDVSTLDLDELARIKVTAVARRPEPVAQASAAVSVISREDIRRSGAASLPEALRLLPGLAVAQAGTRDWAVSSRGFNEQTSNKMLVLVDGRVVYSPIFAGVFWDVQQVPLEAIDRIELIRGPGAALWGANAVNGVINVVTRPATESRGGVASLLGGTNDQAQADVRYGGGLGRHGAIRGYGLAYTEGASDLENGAPAADDARKIQGGFRADLHPQPNQSFTLQGDIYGGTGGNLLELPQPTPPFVSAVAEDLHTNGGNLLGRWQRQFSAGSDLAAQAYVDYASRSQPAFFGRMSVTTFDVDFQHHIVLGGKHDVPHLGV
jgi:iron complex outermembrane receptor protein